MSTTHNHMDEEPREVVKHLKSMPKVDAPLNFNNELFAKLRLDPPEKKKTSILSLFTTKYFISGAAASIIMIFSVMYFIQKEYKSDHTTNSLEKSAPEITLPAAEMSSNDTKTTDKVTVTSRTHIATPAPETNTNAMKTVNPETIIQGKETPITNSPSSTEIHPTSVEMNAIPQSQELKAVEDVQQGVITTSKMLSRKAEKLDSAKDSTKKGVDSLKNN